MFTIVLFPYCVIINKDILTVEILLHSISAWEWRLNLDVRYLHNAVMPRSSMLDKNGHRIHSSDQALDMFMRRRQCMLKDEIQSQQE